MNSSVDRSSELAEKDGTKCGRFMKLCVGFLRSFTKSGAEDMRNFRNFHAKITPLIAVFALVAFSIFAFTKLPAFAQNSAQDLSKTDAFSAGSEQDLNKTEVLCKDSAGSEQDVQNGSAQSVPSNEQAQTAQNSVITPLDAQTEQNQHAQDNCVQTHSAEQDLESNSPITHLNTQISAQVPSRVQSTTITPKASAGANIELSDGDETTASGTGWTYADGVYTINSGATAEANLTISGSTMNKRVVVASDTTATVTLSGSSITNGVPAFGLSSGSNLTLKLSGSNVLSTSSDDNAGLNVPGGATVTIESISEGASLTANAGNYGAGIGGGDHGSGGNITIAGGIINATGGHGGAGIGGGYCGSGGSITIAGGKITTNGGTYGAGIGGGAEASGGTINISGGTIVAINGGWSSAIGGGYEGSSTGTTNITGGTIIGLDNIGTSTTNVSGYPVILAKEVNGKTASAENRANGILIGDDVTIDTSTIPITITIQADLTIPSGAVFTIPAGVKVVVPSGKTLTVANGATLDVAVNNGTITIDENANCIVEPDANVSGTIGGDGTIEHSGANVTALTFDSKTTTSITVTVPSLFSATSQDIEYAINTTQTVPTEEANWYSTSSDNVVIDTTTITFSNLNPSTTYYIFARSKVNDTYKAGTAKILEVTTIIIETTPAFAINYADETLDTGTSAKYQVCYTATGEPQTCTNFPSDPTSYEPVNSITINENWLGQNLAITKIARDSNYSNSSAQSITLPARPSAPAQGENTFQVTGEHVYTDEYETLAIQPGYEYYKLSNTPEDTAECSNTTTGYTQVSGTAIALTGADNIGTYCVRKSAVNTGEEASRAFHSSAAKASVRVGTEVHPDPTPIDPISPETPEELIINPSEIQGAWVDANGVVHANQNGTITILLHEKLHDGTQKLAELEDYKLTSSVDTDIIKDNTVTFPHASPHIITASLKSNSALTTQVKVEVEPVSTPVDPTTPTTPASPSASNTSSIGTAITGVPANALGLIMLMMLLVGAGFVRARRKMV